MWLVEWEILNIIIYCGPFKTKKEAQVEMVKRALQDAKEYRVVFDPDFK